MRHAGNGGLQTWIQVGVSVFLAILTAVYVWLTRSLANVAREQLDAARENENARRLERETDRRTANERVTRSLVFLARHLLKQVEIIENARSEKVLYRGLRETALPRMDREITDLMLLSREAPGIDLDGVHRAVTALTTLASYAEIVQRAPAQGLRTDQEEALPKQLSEALTSLRALDSTATT